MRAQSWEPGPFKSRNKVRGEAAMKLRARNHPSPKRSPGRTSPLVASLIHDMAILLQRTTATEGRDVETFNPFPNTATAR